MYLFADLHVTAIINNRAQILPLLICPCAQQQPQWQRQQQRQRQLSNILATLVVSQSPSFSLPLSLFVCCSFLLNWKRLTLKIKSANKNKRNNNNRQQQRIYKSTLKCSGRGSNSSAQLCTALLINVSFITFFLFLLLFKSYFLCLPCPHEFWLSAETKTAAPTQPASLSQSQSQSQSSLPSPSPSLLPQQVLVLRHSTRNRFCPLPD